MFLSLNHLLLTMFASSIFYKNVECLPFRHLARFGHHHSLRTAIVDLSEILHDYDDLLVLSDGHVDIEEYDDKRTEQSEGGHHHSRKKQSPQTPTEKRFFVAADSAARIDWSHYASRIREKESVDRMHRSEWNIDSLKNPFRKARMNQMLYG